MISKTKQLTLAAMFLAISIVLCLIQIPIAPGLGLSLDFAYVALLLSRRYVGNTYTFLIAAIFPWFTLLSTGNGALPGAIFLFVQGLVLVFLDIMFNNNKWGILGIIIVIVGITLLSTLINVLLIAPMYDPSYWNAEHVWDNIEAWTIISLIFNPFKMTIIYITLVLVYLPLKKVKEH